MGRFACCLVLAVYLAACGGDGALPTGPSPVSADVEIAYALSPMKEASPLAAVDCAGQVRLYPSWWGFSQVTMAPTDTGRWGLLFEEVPIGPQRVNVIAPEECGVGTFAVNGVVLHDASAAGATSLDSGGFSFTLHPDGSVSP